jgi:hypothetical protein
MCGLESLQRGRCTDRDDVTGCFARRNSGATAHRPGINYLGQIPGQIVKLRKGCLQLIAWSQPSDFVKAHHVGWRH